MTEAEVIRAMRGHLEGQFPKVCPACQRRFAALREYLLTTEHLGPAFKLLSAAESEIRVAHPVACTLVRRASGRDKESNSLPTRTTKGNNASTSANSVRKFTMHARSANLPWITAFERKASPLFCRRVSSSQFNWSR